MMACEVCEDFDTCKLGEKCPVEIEIRKAFNAAWKDYGFMTAVRTAEDMGMTFGEIMDKFVDMTRA